MGLILAIVVLAEVASAGEGGVALNEAGQTDNELNREDTNQEDSEEAEDTIDIEPSEFALSDDEYDPDFDNGDEDNMLVHRSKDSDESEEES